MSHVHRNFILAYALLVALPVVGLIGVLKSGRRLSAPISVDGVWQLQADPARLAAVPCGQLLADTPALTISQSGRNFTLSVSNSLKSAASGVIEGTTLKASLMPSSAWSAEGGCGDNRELSLVATVDPTAAPRTLVGVLSVNDCPSCASVAFRAVRQAPPTKKGAD
jgi:hypothetical protein